VPVRDRIVGILGGMGPAATADLYSEIIRLTPARSDQDHIRILIYSNPKIPDRTRALLEGGADPLPELVASARVLETAGAGILAIPCNNAHCFLDGIRSRVGIPVLDMIEETRRALQSREPQIRRVGLLAATGTVKTGIYERAFGAAGIEVLLPEEADQARVLAAIREVKSGNRSTAVGDVFHRAGASLVARGAASVVLGCTEIPLVFEPSRARYATTNPTAALAAAALAWALETPA
jgi:aspartate racemase